MWIGRYGEFEDSLKTASIVRMQDIGTGVTHPRRAFFAAGGLATSAVVKNLPPGVHGGFWDSYKSEIAAYELDKSPRPRHGAPHRRAAASSTTSSPAQLWVEDCRPGGEDVDPAQLVRPGEHGESSGQP